MTDYRTKPIKRAFIRSFSKYIRSLLGLNYFEPFPVLIALEKLPFYIKGTECIIVEDQELPVDVFAQCYPKVDGGFVIEIKQTVYDGAYNNHNRAFLSFICHEISHVFLFSMGYMPVSLRSFKKDERIPAYCSVEWQAKALCGELMIPYEATVDMDIVTIMEKYHVTEASAKYRVNLSKNLKAGRVG